MGSCHWSIVYHLWGLLWLPNNRFGPIHKIWTYWARVLLGAPSTFRKCHFCPSVFLFKLAALSVFFYISSFVSFILLRFLPFVVVFAVCGGFFRSWWFLQVSRELVLSVFFSGFKLLVFFSAEVHILWLLWVSCKM